MIHAPEIKDGIWVNSPPVTSESLKGRAVLYDFWTYSCVNCLRTMPYLKKWWQTYQDKGLLILGIHSPEFEFEKNPRNVKEAIKNLGITWPVVLDNDHQIWDAFANHYWPAKYLANREGQIIYNHFGEGAYDDTEEFIQIALGNKEDLPIVVHHRPQGKVCFVATPELYAGYERGQLTSGQQYFPDEVHSYEKPLVIENHSLALDGLMVAKGEYAETKAPGAGVLVKFQSNEINLVLKPVGEEAIAVLEFNHEPVGEYAGKDVVDSEVKVIEPRMYNLLKSNKPISGLFSIRAKKGSFRVYAFTFSGCL